ncbi:MAG: DUF192 domain-containing protein [Patescibacteria group bacterium]
MKQQILKSVLLLLVCLSVLGILILIGNSVLSYRGGVKDIASVIDGFQYEIAKTDSEKERGLSGRPYIQDNYGMLFVFDTPGNYGFWMKDMLVSIDIIWLSDNGTILGINPSVTPATYPNVFYPPSPVRYVLETRTDYAHDAGWVVGSRVTLPPQYARTP